MALTGEARRDNNRAYKRERRARARADREIEPMDRDVLRLAIAGYTNLEIQELLDISEEALLKELDRVAEYLCPTPASKMTVDPAKCQELPDVA
jgi:DNA-binding CsgD family transcriptional regulator